jgi:hypothetical protein
MLESSSTLVAETENVQENGVEVHSKEAKSGSDESDSGSDKEEQLEEEEDKEGDEEPAELMSDEEGDLHDEEGNVIPRPANTLPNRFQISREICLIIVISDSIYRVHRYLLDQLTI